MDTLGTRFAQALARKDFDAVAGLLHPQVDFRAMTPRRTWEAADPQAVVMEVLTRWFEDSDDIQELERVDQDAFADRERVGYRLRVRCPDGMYRVEQQAYLSELDGRIGWMRVLCSGYRPIAAQ
ncbi:MAG TPA: hypothetical protein VMT10_08630 [Solirubrobacteraceae bacterium]|nr:hypothetical protein [Solirubrobacteraceae bacterium]